MTEKMIRDAYCKIRTIDQTIPDDVLDFMKDAALEKLNRVNKNYVLVDVNTSLYGLYSPEDELMFVHKTREGAKKHQYEFEKAHGFGFYVDSVIILE